MTALLALALAHAAVPGPKLVYNAGDPYIVLTPSAEVAVRLPRSEGPVGDWMPTTVLSADEVLGVAKGSVWSVYDGGGPAMSCTVTGFTGVNLDADVVGGAPCAAPMVRAELSCDTRLHGWTMLAVPSDARQPTVFAPTRKDRADAVGAARSLEAWRVLRAEAAAASVKLGLPMEEGVEASEYTANGRTFVVVSLSLQVGEFGCGLEHDPYDTTLHALFADDGGGLELVWHREAAGVQQRGLLDLDGDGVPETIEQGWTTTAVVAASGEDVFEQTLDFCECPC